ncbi:hypothetical protein [Candidatus Macondimonas diazotrophica]|jgi:hypothetical protein|uniref:Uncharacterized protein n=1 Tax=Candidatus Macondimonas diazotrophica TaxID=2305248 RepID=A0A4Z0F831_9GAMM|nr:hypothetical protein [Candidatus Macondimonas diazotrophica]TFZ81616.1 hypothetical protein E4680_11580 [Candidatus Macondimonas diazotrophica]
MESLDIESLGNIGGLVGLLGVAGMILWQAYKNLSPKWQEDKSRLDEATGAAHTDLMARFDRIRQNETECLDRIEELEQALDAERAIRRAAEDEAAQERIMRKTWETRHRRAVEELARLGREDLAKSIEALQLGASSPILETEN